MFKLLKFFTFLAVLIFLVSSLNKLTNQLQSFFQANRPQVGNSILILERMRSVSELTTAIFVMESVVPVSQDWKVGDWTLGKTKLLYIAQGEVRSGIDLQSLSPTAMQINEKKISVQLPPAKILDAKLDVNNSQVYDYDRGFLSLGPDVGIQLQTVAQQETLAKIRKTACEKGILEQASQNAKLAMTQLLREAGYEQIEIKINSSTSGHC